MSLFRGVLLRIRLQLILCSNNWPSLEVEVEVAGVEVCVIVGPYQVAQSREYDCTVMRHHMREAVLLTQAVGSSSHMLRCGHVWYSEPESGLENTRLT